MHYTLNYNPIGCPYNLLLIIMRLFGKQNIKKKYLLKISTYNIQLHLCYCQRSAKHDKFLKPITTRIVLNHSILHVRRSIPNKTTVN